MTTKKENVSFGPIWPKRFIQVSIIIALLLGLFANQAFSVEVQLAWEPNQEDHLAGYRLYVAEQGQAYDYSKPLWEGWLIPKEAWQSSVDCTEERCRCSVILEEDKMWCFVIRAFCESEKESASSEEVCLNLVIQDTSLENRTPETPLIAIPYPGETEVSLTPILSTAGFLDPEGNKNVVTTWQISRSATDFSEKALVFALDTDKHLATIQVPDGILEEETTYYWRARYQGIFSLSEWSEVGRFVTCYEGKDVEPVNGVPDDQEVGPDTDLDENGIPDVLQGDMKCVKSTVDDIEIGVKAGGNVVAIETVEAIDAENFPLSDAMPDEIPFGMVGFRGRMGNAGQVGEIIIYYSEPLPMGARWYKYDSAVGWQPGDLSMSWAVSDDRLSVTLYIEDGGQGDADGVRNGYLVDPGGMGITYPTVSSEENTLVASDAGAQGGGGGGCFLSLPLNADTGFPGLYRIRMYIACVSRLFFIIGFVLVVIQVRRRNIRP